jgi:hypothetical protein
MNCGCGRNNDDMGNQDNITMETVKKAAQAGGTTVQEALLNLKKAIEQELAT